MRCGTPGMSWHVTAKSSFCDGVCFINPALMQGKLCALPREICTVLGGSRAEVGVIPPDHGAEVSRGHSRGASLEGPNGMRRRSRLVPNGLALHLSSSVSCLRLVRRMKPGLGHEEGHSGLHLEPAEVGVGAIQHQVPRQQFAERQTVRDADPISRTAVYVTRMHGGVGGGGP
jgi:hypothetical protein